MNRSCLPFIVSDDIKPPSMGCNNASENKSTSIMSLQCENCNITIFIPMQNMEKIFGSNKDPRPLNSKDVTSRCHDGKYDHKARYDKNTVSCRCAY